MTLPSPIQWPREWWRDEWQQGKPIMVVPPSRAAFAKWMFGDRVIVLEPKNLPRMEGCNEKRL